MNKESINKAVDLVYRGSEASEWKRDLEMAKRAQRPDVVLDMQKKKLVMLSMVFELMYQCSRQNPAGGHNVSKEDEKCLEEFAAFLLADNSQVKNYKFRPNGSSEKITLIEDARNKKLDKMLRLLSPTLLSKIKRWVQGVVKVFFQQLQRLFQKLPMGVTQKRQGRTSKEIQPESVARRSDEISGQKRDVIDDTVTPTKPPIK